MQTLWLCGELEILFYAPVAIVSTYLSKHRCNLQWRIYKDDAYAWEMVTRMFSHMNWFNSKSDEHILSVRCPRFHINQTKRKRLCWTYGHHSKIYIYIFHCVLPILPMHKHIRFQHNWSWLIFVKEIMWRTCSTIPNFQPIECSAFNLTRYDMLTDYHHYIFTQIQFYLKLILYS